MSLDVLRAAACLLVIASHSHFPDRFPVLQTLGKGGWAGVDLFFVLSGFLVSGILFHEFKTTHSLNIGRFLLRRGLKIYPPFYFFILTTATYLTLLGNDASFASKERLLTELLFVQNFWPGFWGYTWSLAVEEHFYITVAILVWMVFAFGKRLDGIAIPVIMIAIAIIALLLRWRLAQIPFHLKTHWFPTQLRMDALAFGVLLAHAWNFRQDWIQRWLFPWRWQLLVAGVGGCMPPFQFEKSQLSVLGLTALYLSCGSLLLGLRMVGVPNVPLTRMIAAMGAQSYSIYLWHGPIVWNLVPKMAARFHVEHSLLPAVAGLSLSIVFGILMAHLVESPILELRDRWTSNDAQA